MRKSGQDQPGKVVPGLGDDDDEDVRPMPNNRNNIQQPPAYTAPPRVTETFKEPAKGSVNRAAPQPRQPTKIEAIRLSKTIGGAGNSGAQRSLLVGGAPAASGQQAAREGIRPVALQPLQSSGKGGRGGFEGGYAEMARSLLAMNQGPAKQGVFAAQLRDVDGAPLGAAGFAGGQGGRTGAGGAPSNNVAYKPHLPWWWDFEKSKLMKRWELWHYNWEKALSDSLIKMATGLFQCLVAGKADGSIDNFLGTPKGDSEWICMKNGKAVDGMASLNNYAKIYQFGQGGGDSQTNQGVAGSGIINIRAENMEMC